MSRDTPTCKCGKLMGKAGLATSGTHKVQRYRCSKCGATTTKLNSDTSQSNHNHHNRHIVDLDDLEEAQLQVRSLKSSMSIEQYLKALAFREH